MQARTSAALLVLVAASLALRTGALGSGFWIDEAIAVGIARRPLPEIPGTLLLDGSPPLYYLLLHAWMAIAGDGEAATRVLSLAIATAAIPVALWAGRATGGPAAGWIAAGAVAVMPFLTRYAQETRMYALVALLSLVAAAAFVLAFVEGRDRHRWTFGATLLALLLTHNWALFLGAAFALAWLMLWRRGTTGGRGAVVFAAVAAGYLPWLPSLLEQVAHTGAPWAEAPALHRLLGQPVELLGAAALPAVLLAAVVAARRRPTAAVVLLGVAAVAGLLAWTGSQVEPAYALRYLAVLVGPLVLGVAAALAAAPWERSARAALALAAVGAVVTPVPEEKSNVREVAGQVAPLLRPGDVVVSTAPEQVPVLARYLPDGLRWRTPLGRPADPRVTDWRDGARRLAAASVRGDLLPVVDDLRVGGRLVLVTAFDDRPESQAPWTSEVRRLSTTWRDAVRDDERLQLLRTAGSAPTLRNSVTVAVYERMAAPSPAA